MNEYFSLFLHKLRLLETHFHMQMITLRPSLTFSTFFLNTCIPFFQIGKKKVKATYQAGTEADDGGVLLFSVDVSIIKTVSVHRFHLILCIILLVRSVARAKDGYGIKRRNKSRLERQVKVIVTTKCGESVVHVLGFPVSRFCFLVDAPFLAFEVRVQGQRISGLGHSDRRHDLVRSGVHQ